MGFSCTVFCWLLMFYLYGFTTEGPVDSWFCYLVGVSYFVYSTLDNLDGKQAKRTGSGSPMGMLFDHGCDATTAILQSMILLKVCQIGSSWRMLLAAFMPTVPFYYMTLETYYLGRLK